MSPDVEKGVILREFRGDWKAAFGIGKAL